VPTQQVRRTAGGHRDARAAIRREQLLDAALRLFCEHGYAATTTKRIAEAVGVAEGLVFHYFASKEALLLELASRQHTFAGRVLTLIRDVGEGSARDLLAAVADGLGAVSADEAAFIPNMQSEAQNNPALRTQIIAATDVVLEGFVEVLERRVAAGELRADAPLRAAALGFFGGFQMFFAQHRQLGAAAWRREAGVFAHAWAELCWRGLASAQSLSGDSANPPMKRKRGAR
jgi:AcrR family transcriptional regulator